MLWVWVQGCLWAEKVVPCVSTNVVIFNNIKLEITDAVGKLRTTIVLFVKTTSETHEYFFAIKHHRCNVITLIMIIIIVFLIS